MKDLPNIEKSAFRPGEYVGYAHGVWRIMKSNSSDGNWVAIHRDIPNQRLATFRLADLSKKLERYNP